MFILKDSSSLLQNPFVVIFMFANTHFYLCSLFCSCRLCSICDSLCMLDTGLFLKLKLIFPLLPLCKGTVESQPEPLIDHLRRVLSQLQRHRWMQFHLSYQKGWSQASYTPFKGWLPRRKDLYLEITSLGALLWAQDMGKIFISFLLCNAIISLVQYLYTCLPYTCI